MDANQRQAFQASTELGTGNAAYVDALYEQYLADPASVSEAWRKRFDALKGREAGDVPHGPIQAQIAELARSGQRRAVAAQPGDGFSHKQAAVLKLVTAYRSRGHVAADLDPLGLWEKPAVPDLSPAFHGLGDGDLDSEFDTGSLTGPSRLPLRGIIDLLKRTYTGSIGAEFMHITDTAQRQWWHQRLEAAAGKFGFDAESRKRLLLKLTQAEGLERYLHTRYVGQKRFSLEGGDSLIPLMDTFVRKAGASRVREMVIGMAHRGRLNVLVNTLGKPPQQLFAEFEGRHDGPEDPAHSGDVKYHMGFSSDVATPDGPLHLALGFNPSHLEIIDPVIAGSVRSRQTRRGDDAREQVLPVLLHGDAAFAGQGVVMELFNMSQARGFKVGGTLHVVINNQVGFTTSRPDDARSTLYCTDVAKMVNAPVLHVNGDDVEAVAFCAQLAFDYRQQFKRDVVIDLVCYRRHGHNEADEPAATQPLMYKTIRAHKTTRERYAQTLQDSGIISADEARAMVDSYRDRLDKGEVTIELAEGIAKDDFALDWTPYLHHRLDEPADTGVARDTLLDLANRITTLPEGYTLHSRVAKIYDDRRKMTAGELPMDWGYAENLSYASLLNEGFRLRLVGQDCGRGTFFHRHAVLHEQNTGQSILPLQSVAGEPGHVQIYDSVLSEEAVLAFEYGYATADPQTLVIWEAQFGDFVNGAQVVIDQFLSSGEAKWGRLAGLVMFLPHGYEGQGPEHSSARLERFLQLCALDNMQVCTPTTPAQMFHMLRRQMKRPARKPLIVMTPKSMLRHKLSVSTMDDLAQGEFQRLIPDSTAGDAKKVKRVVVCAGKVYYDLLEEATRRGLTDVALVRVEQLYPFPRDLLNAELSRFAQAKDVVWCQEEPMNQGAWYQIRHHLEYCLGETLPKAKLHYAGRSRSPAPACGHLSTHVAEQQGLVDQALSGRLNGNGAAE
ncbi:2-oxoglutarate dehydrogenase E1 component [Pseudofulvimonas gallinarii]|uniref:2-oxoglutarate dehydrogenase E1 component n=2 Tax=Pseudofulvimonas gallinarii TaxID=634155 RepID=A0A4R3L011_9GAMM|nr:2-oxoglutarate dehydrogenase E1 component [Pseudofulvimonas gallinarii]TCS92524.1 2-oxoglutarate dehydrogenase E1 component [Pseudofulvimonas gallinarii]THD12737.1 2-oxoglutarate dehydrogenase E1 component [Pseudofulvimonas gallinarii]